MIGDMPECLHCKHYHAGNLSANTCTAFPMGIPVEIMANITNHRNPYPGDNGIQFEPIDDAPSDRLAGR